MSKARLGTRKFLVYGFPRSGTTYMSKLFQALGYDVGHESPMGRDGLSSWYYTPGVHRVHRPTPNTGEWDFEHKIFVVRYPFDALISAFFTVKVSHDDMLSSAGLMKEGWTMESVARCMLWFYRSCMRDRPDVTIRVEMADVELPAWLEAHRYAVKRVAAEPPKNCNARPHRDMRLVDIKNQLSEDTFRRINRFAVKHGYPDWRCR